MKTGTVRFACCVRFAVKKGNIMPNIKTGGFFVFVDYFVILKNLWDIIDHVVIVVIVDNTIIIFVITIIAVAAKEIQTKNTTATATIRT